MTKAAQLQQFDKAYEDFVKLVASLTPERFLHSVEDWSPRDIVAHLIGWNQNIRLGCQQIMQGAAPFYHVDGPNDYRSLNAQFITQYNSTDSGALLTELAQSQAELSSFFQQVDERDWDRDFGVLHYRGGAATVSRSAESITRDYVDHAREIAGAAA